MSVEQLNSIEWRGLTVSTFSVSQDGLSLTVDKCPDDQCSCGVVVLHLLRAESMHIQINGSMRPQDFDSIAIEWLVFRTSETGRISGTIALMPGGAGFWQVSFTNALWELRRV